MRKYFSLRGASIALALSLASSGVWAGIPTGASVDYAPLPNAAAVPTLGEWTLILMALLMSVVAYRALRGRVNGRILSNTALITGTLAATLAGHGLVKEVEAAMGYQDYEMSIRTGGTIDGINMMKLINTSGVPQQIKAIRLTGPYPVRVPPQDEAPECNVNLVVAPGNNCYMIVQQAN